MSNVEPIPAPAERDVYLKSFLKPFERWLDDPTVTEIMVNRPGEVWIERQDAIGFERFEDPGVNELLLQRLAVQIARVSHQAINREQPLLAASLPSGERIQIAGPPAAGEHWALAIRRHVTSDLTLSDFGGAHNFAQVAIGRAHGLTETDRRLKSLLDEGRIEEFLRSAVRARKTMLVSGGTSTGKTSLMNALLCEIDHQERIITVEDAAELRLSQPNRLSLSAVKGEMGEARINMIDLLEAALRMRPDRIILGEIRGVEAAAWLRAINTGHPGSITTVHADSPEGALEQLSLMTMQAGLPLSRDETIRYINSIVDTIIHVSRVDGARVIERIVFKPDPQV
ncbi:P-type DNA transfer ATPase VirB11 [Marinicaulis aureus]|uniref:Type IV secretion system protein n=1 Tax=Hyphococcus aureus TaxID=2666033 RepID=A0ABW1L0J3_9PROT